jgi:hypothetical protein
MIMTVNRKRSHSPDDCRKLYCSYYHNQLGGALPVFQGSSVQYGDGLGDILKGVFRFFLPIASSVASKFITTTAHGLESGSSLKDAAKSAILPTVGETIFASANEGHARHRGMSSSNQ